MTGADNPVPVLETASVSGGAGRLTQRPGPGSPRTSPGQVENLGRGAGLERHGCACGGGGRGVSAVIEGDRQLGRSCALTIGGSSSGSASGHSHILEPRPRRDPGRSTQGWACRDLASGVAARSGGHGTTYSQSCCSRRAQGKCPQHLRVDSGREQAVSKARAGGGGEASTEEGFPGNTACSTKGLGCPGLIGTLLSPPQAEKEARGDRPSPTAPAEGPEGPLALPRAGMVSLPICPAPSTEPGSQEAATDSRTGPRSSRGGVQGHPRSAGGRVFCLLSECTCSPEM